jgi:hypothetical protein
VGRITGRKGVFGHLFCLNTLTTHSKDFMATPKFYVYVYLRVDGSPYYVGKGCNGRWKSSKHSVEVPPSDRVIFLITDTTEEWAHFIEMEFIDLHGRLNDGTGILENKTDGGEGTCGRVLSQESKRKISEARKGRVLSEEHKQKIGEAGRGRVHSTETKQKISDANKGQLREPLSEETKRQISEKLKGRPKSEETKRKMSEAKKMLQAHNHPHSLHRFSY